MTELIDFENELFDLFNGINENLRLLETIKVISVRETKYDYIKDRLNRCRKVIEGYKVELRYIKKDKDESYRQKIKYFEQNIDQMYINLESKYKNNDVTMLSSTDKILSRATQIQQKDKQMVIDMLRTVNNIK
jgi:hypothetical protein